jgi:hypothetical protein
MTRSPMPATQEDTLLRWGLAVGAVATAVFLLLVYVQLLRDSMERGSQRRYSVTTAEAAAATDRARARLVSNAR